MSSAVFSGIGGASPFRPHMRLSTCMAIGDIYKSSSLHVGQLSDATPQGPRARDGMTGMALFQGLLDREGRTLEKVRRLVESGGASLNAGAEARAANEYMKALSLLEAQTTPVGSPEDWAEACAKVGAGLFAVGHVESAQVAATEALRCDTANVRALAVQGDLLVAAGRATDAIPYFDAALRANPKAKGVWSRKGNAHASLEQRPKGRGPSEARRAR